MKKTILACMILSAVISGCDRDVITIESTASANSDAETPTASFVATAKTTAGNIVTLEEGTPVAAREVTIRYTGTPSAYKSVFTGDPGKIYIEDPANPPAGVSTAQAGVVLRDSLKYTYPAAGTYNIVVITSSIGNKGRDIKRSIARKRITLQ